jgi:Fe2+ or Zn2+ uptake regulation protein
MDIEAIRQRLDAHGVRFTSQRYCVMAYLMENPSHPTAAEIFEGVNRLDPRSSMATVYRNLHDLVEAGIVREVAVEGRSARFDLKGMPHHHFICDRCGEVENMDWFDVSKPPPDAVGARVIRECEVIFRGFCSRCAVAGSPGLVDEASRASAPGGKLE